MPREGSLNLDADVEHDAAVDRQYAQKLSPQPPAEDPIGDEKSRRWLWIVFAILTFFFVIGFAFTLVRKEEVAAVQTITGQSVTGVIDERYKYNGFNFVKLDDIWYTELMHDNRRINVPLHYGPKEVELINITGELDTRFTSARLVYIAFNPVDENLTYVALANGELGLSLVKAMGLKLKAACTQNETAPCAKQPILSCPNETTRALIELRQADEEAVQYMGNCIVLSGRDMGLVRAVDRLLLKWYGIME